MMSDSDGSLLTADVGQKNLFLIHEEEIIKEITQPSHLLPHLHFSREIILTISEKEKQCREDATRMMCEQLLKSTDSKWFLNFKDTLLKCGYEKLYKLLSLEDVKDERKYELVLQWYFPELIDVNPDDILPTLYSRTFITKREKEDIEAEKRNKSPTAAMQKLLCIIPKKVNWFPALCEVLKENKYSEILKEINPKLLTAASPEDISMIVANLTLGDKKEQSPKVAVVKPTLQSTTSHDKSVETPVKLPDPTEQSSTDCKTLVYSATSSSSLATSETPVKQSQVTENTAFTSRSRYLDTQNASSIESVGESHRRERQGSGVGTSRKHVEIERDVDRNQLAQDDGLLDLRSDCYGTVPCQQQAPTNSSEQSDSYNFDCQSGSTTMTDGPSCSGSTPARTVTTSDGDMRTDVTRGSPKDASREPLELRGYQRELAADALLGHNCLIVAPTGCGKTHVALAIAKHVYDNATQAEDPKIAFLVPTVALVSQQCNQFSRYMNVSCRCIGLSGEEELKLSLKNLIEVNDVLVMTPQILLNALDKNILESLSVFSLLIFDECHKMTKNHPYNDIMSKYYVDVLLKENVSGAAALTTVQLPQVIGLTASPGVGQANSLEKAVEHIQQLCANMSATKISTVRNPTNLAELARYENKPTEDTEEVRGREYDPFGDLLQIAMSQIENRIKQKVEETPQLVLDIPNIHQLIGAPANRGSDPYVQFVSKLKKQIAIVYDQAIRKCFVACLRHLEVYNNALLINADCRTKDALNFIVKEFEQFERNRGSLAYDETDRWLEKLYTDMLGKLTETSRDPRNENPKLKKLQEKITEYYKEDRNSQGIIFCKTRELTAAMVNWMKETTNLAWLNPHHLVGANKSSQSGATAMTHNKLEDVLKYFKGGEHKIIVATSVAEEGLDVKSCNYVIRYNHVTNDIARIQARGRARAGNAQYLLVADQGQGTVARDEVNKSRESLMNEAIKYISTIPREKFEEKIKELQVKSKVDRDGQAHGKMLGELQRKARSHDGDYELRCVNCDALCVWSSDLRTIDKAHHITIDEDFESRIELRPHPQPKKYDNWEKKAKIDCVKCRYDWGIKALYRSVPYHVLKVESFVLISPHGERLHCKKWKGIPFNVHELSLEDMQLMLSRAMAIKTDSTSEN